MKPTLSTSRRGTLLFLVLFVLAALFWIERPRSEPGTMAERGTTPPTAAAASEPAARPSSANLSAPDEGRTGREEPAPARAGASDSAARGVVGRVVSAEGAPLSGLSLAVADRIVTRSDANGVFWLEREPLAEARITLASAGYETLVAGRAEAGACVVVGAATIELGGRVHDREGSPVNGARVELVIPAAGLERARAAAAAFQTVGEAVNVDVRLQLETDADGAFWFASAPLVRGARMVVTHPDFVTWRGLEPMRPRTDIEVELLRAFEEGERGQLVGRVVSPSGVGIEAALVRLRERETQTDSLGQFTLPVGRPGTTDALVAVAPGHVPAVLEDLGAWLRASEGFPGPIELVLFPGPAEIEGVLIDAVGRPCVGWQIKLLDGTVVATPAKGPLLAEDLAAERSGPLRTAANGGFSFGGLVPGRTYRLRAWNERTLQIVESEAILANSWGVRLEVPPEPFRETVDGIVVGTSSEPLAGVRVRLTMEVHALDASSWMHSNQEVRTDKDGGFRFRDVPQNELFLRFERDGLVPKRVDLPPADSGRELVVQLLGLGELRFDHALYPDPPTLRLLDDDDQALEFRIRDGDDDRTRRVHRLQLSGERTPTLVVREDVRRVVLELDGVELLRRAIHVPPGAFVVVEL